MSDIWHDVISAEAFPAEGKFATTLNNWHILVTKIDGEFFAMNDRCPHQASLLSTGRLRRGAIMCPLHGARFEAKSGRCIGGSYKDVRTFPVREWQGTVQIQVPDHAPTIDELPM